MCEGNIFWNRRLFQCESFGAESLDSPDYPHRDFIWARLIVKANHLPLFVSTVHLPWSGCKAEVETGVNQRIVCMRRICRFLGRLPRPNEPIVFGGDFNDDFHPLRMLVEELGMMDVFESLDLPPPITHPVRPSSFEEEGRPNRTLDWITCFLPHGCRVLGAFAKSLRGGRFPPSDHLPVVALIEVSSPSEVA